MQYSVTLRNNQLEQLENTITASNNGTLVLYSGSIPGNCASADSGTSLATIVLTNDSWLSAASAGSVSKSGTWSVAATNTGTLTHFRIKDNSGVCHIQGTVGTSGTDMIVDNTSLSSGQTVTVNSFTITAGNS